MSAYAPYSQTAPQTDDVRELRAELVRVREVYGRGSSQGAEAYNRLSRAAAAQGHPLSALRRHTVNEVERFFSRTIAGADGHTYWDGDPKGFVRNDGKWRMARRWWWEHHHGTVLKYTDDVWAICGEKNCITPEHNQFGRSPARQWYTDAQVIGALQVEAMRLGHTPSRDEWERSKRRPSYTGIAFKFGTWSKALAAAGFTPRAPKVEASTEACLQSVRHLRVLLGHWPTHTEFVKHADALREAGLPSSHSTLLKYCGGIVAARRMAGGE